MAESHINIADFRCRAINYCSAQSPVRSAKQPRGIMLLELEPAGVEREAVLLKEAMVSKNPAVFDIGIAREATRLRPRLVLRPVAIQRRRANVIRFGEPGVAVMRGEPSRRGSHWPGMSDDYDSPPAA